jgi:prepilin-type processing-associated H-X9-DG protein
MTQLAMDVSRKARGKVGARIVGIGTATPPAAPQEEALRFAMTLSGLAEDQHAWLKRIYRQSGIQSRGSVLLREGEDHYQSAREFFPASKGPEDRGPGTAARMAVYAREAPKLALRSAGAALENSKTPAGEITHLITASCTGFYAPGLDAALIEGLGLDRGVRRAHVGFMGCHAAFNALSVARDIAAAHREARVLVCCVELCSLQWAYGADPGKLVANALFADGSASAVIASGGYGSGGCWEIEDFSSYLIPESSDAMTWNLGDHGFEMTLSPGVPEIIRKNLAGWCDAWLGKEELSRADISGWAIHPGGPKILEAVREGLELGAEDVRFSREVLSQHGNMSSATVLFILDRMAREITGRVVAIGLGPGLIAEGMRVRR